MKVARLALVFAVIGVGGCSSMQRVEFQNDGPGPVTVTYRFRQERDKAPTEETVELGAGESKIEGVWFYEAPPELTIEAKWGGAVRRETYRVADLPPGLARSTSGGGIHGLSLSPDGFRWGLPTLWVRIQNPALLPAFIFTMWFGLWGYRRWRRAQG